MLVYVGWTWFHWFGDRTVVSDLAPIPLELGAAMLAWWTSRAEESVRVRTAWRLVSIALLLWVGGETAWMYLEVVRDTSPFPSWADALYLAFYPVMFAGMLRMPVRRTARHDRIALALDVATVMLATLMLVWYLVVEPTVSSTQPSGLSELLSLAYPAGDLILVLGVTRVLLRRVPGESGAPFFALAGSLTVLAVADILYAHLELTGTYGPGTAPDALWMIAMTGIAVAAALQYGRPAPRLSSIDANAGGRVSKLPYVAVLVGSMLVLYETYTDASSAVTALVLGASGLTGLVVWRQLTVMNENARLVSRLDRLANTDPLTGLPNRRQFVDVANRVLTRAGQSGEPVSLIMLDVDHFKRVNDAHGHAVGDEVLELVSRRGTEVLRPTDLLARYAGDEFVILLPGTGASAANDVARRIGDRIASADFHVSAGDVPVTVSMGVATTFGDETMPELLRLADEALYQAKAGGRNQFVLHAD